MDYAPWKGGYYERLVGLTKRSLRKTLGKRKAKREQLMTLLHELEAVNNSPPLTYMDNDIISAKTLTPSHFLSINCETGVPDVEIEYNIIPWRIFQQFYWRRGNKDKKY